MQRGLSVCVEEWHRWGIHVASVCQGRLHAHRYSIWCSPVEISPVSSSVGRHIASGGYHRVRGRLVCSNDSGWRECGAALCSQSHLVPRSKVQRRRVTGGNGRMVNSCIVGGWCMPLCHPCCHRWRLVSCGVWYRPHCHFWGLVSHGVCSYS